MTERTSGVRTFLIADIRGYSRYTEECGDEAAARLSAKFARIVNEEVDAYDGALVETRGDEALVVFTSARSRAAASSVTSTATTPSSRGRTSGATSRPT